MGALERVTTSDPSAERVVFACPVVRALRRCQRCRAPPRHSSDNKSRNKVTQTSSLEKVTSYFTQWYLFSIAVPRRRKGIAGSVDRLVGTQSHGCGRRRDLLIGASMVTTQDGYTLLIPARRLARIWSQLRDSEFAERVRA